MDTLLQDLRFGVRLVLRQSAFTLLVVVTLALGARSNDVLRLVIRQGITPALVGIALGLLAALAGSRLLEGLLYGVSATDPLSFVIVPVFLAGVALFAAWLPARRATRVDPTEALRQE